MDNGYELFFNLGVVEDLSDYNINDTGKFEINYLLTVIDGDSDFKYTSGFYGIFVKKIMDKYLKDYGYLAGTQSIVDFLQRIGNFTT